MRLRGRMKVDDYTIGRILKDINMTLPNDAIDFEEFKVIINNYV